VPRADNPTSSAIQLYHLLRLPNLVIVALTQVLVYFYILRPSLLQNGLAASLPATSFWELVLATVIVTAAGYLINDLFDRTTDRFNLAHPPAVETFGVGRARWLYAILVLSGAGLSIDLARRLDEWEWLWLYP
jgi:4-hydroxybenzoate polyprenyltransferase